MKNFFAFFSLTLIANALQGQIVISEIMYNPPEAGSDSLEYIELHNPTNAPINVNQWFFEGVDFQFPDMFIPAGGYVLTAYRASAIQNVFGVQAMQWNAGALSNGGESLKLYDNTGALKDEVAYDDAAPWPTDAAGNGYSIELCDANADNSQASNWKAAKNNTGVIINSKPVFGTPGTVNTVTCYPDADHVVVIQNFFFNPADITIEQGESVIWINQQGTHNVNGTQATFPQNPASFSSGAPAAAPWFFIDTFDVAGVYSYRCDLHFGQGMVGKVTVLPKEPEKIVITEIMYNDPGPDSLEYIEVYNNGLQAVDVSGWYFTQGIDFAFPAGSSMAPGQYVVIAKYPAYFESYFGFTPQYTFTGSLVNTGEDLELRNATNEVIDYLDYLPGGAWPSGANGGGPSLVLCDPNDDNGDPANWADASTQSGFAINNIDVLANPGQDAGCPTNIVAFDDVASALSGQTTIINVLDNDFLPNPASSVSVTTNATHGLAVVNADKTITYTSQAGYCGADEFQYSVTDGTSTGAAKVSVTVKCYPQYAIPTITGENAEGVADSLNVFCETSAIVYGVNLRAGLGLNFYIIDNQNNGINIFRNNGDASYSVTEGDEVAVRGKVDQFRGLTEIVADTVIRKSANNALINPLVVVKPSEATESKFIKINNLHLVNPAEWTTGSGNGGFTVRAVSDDHPNDTVSVRVDNDVDLYNAPAPAYPFNLKGIGGQNDQNAPFTSNYQILPRYTPDLELIIGTHEADFSAHVSIAPNPATVRLAIRTDLAFDVVQIFAPDGRAVRTLQEPDLEEIIDVQGFANGVYFVRFEKDGAFWTARFVKI